MFTAVFLALATLAGSSIAAESVLTYTADSFKAEVPKQNHLVMFYAPWCGHCKRLHPTWEDLAAKYNEKDEEERDVLIAKVDCTVETSVCSDQDVTGYPTLKFFKKDVEEGEKYRGRRDLDSLVKFINKKMGIEQPEEAVAEPEIAKADKGLYTLNDRSFANHIKEGDHFVKFYAPWCGHCQKLAPVWDELAAEYESAKGVSVAKLDCTAAGGICQENDVKGYPTLAYFRNGKKVETYRGARSLKELSDFVKSMREEKTDSGDSDKVPEPVKSDVVVLNKDDFESTIKEGVTFVKFFAPWCGHCKRLSPTWDELAAKYASNKDVKIAKVDCTSDDNKNKELCSKEGVNGFPTLNLYKNGEKAEEFSGQRGLEQLEAFVEKHAKAGKDEL